MTHNQNSVLRLKYYFHQDGETLHKADIVQVYIMPEFESYFSIKKKFSENNPFYKKIQLKFEFSFAAFFFSNSNDHLKLLLFLNFHFRIQLVKYDLSINCMVFSYMECSNHIYLILKKVQERTNY